MSARRSRSRIAAGVLLAVAGSTATATMQPQQAPQQLPGSIRSRITLVPLDVRVTDRQGRFVTGLKEDDFIVLENGKPQQVGHFSFQTLTPDAPGPARPALRKALSTTVEEPTHRTFLLLFGRGRLDTGTKPYDAAIRFVREQLLPQDKIAVAAWNRTTDFTTDHASLIPLLERLKAKHDGIELKLALRETGLEGAFGSRDIPAPLQKDIDNVFEAAHAPRPRAFASVRLNDEEGYENALRRETERAFDRLTGEGEPLNDRRLEDFFFYASVGRSVVTSLYSAIEYLKYFDGEKHLVVINEGGIYLPRAEDERGFAATAADARVAVHTIISGGVPSTTFGGIDMASSVPSSQTAINAPLKSVYDTALSGSAALPNTPIGHMFAIGSMKAFSKMTGGQSTLYRKAAEAFDRIDGATRSHYVLGYYPADVNWDGDWRKIDVKVKRPGLTVSVRRGYYGTDKIIPTNRQTFLTHTRIATAGNYSRPITDIKLTLRAASASRTEVVAEGTIDPSSLTFEQIDGVRGGQVDLAIFVGDREENVIGERWQKIDLKLGADAMKRLTEKGVPFSVRIPINGTPRYMKAIAYDYASDLVGSATTRIR